MSYVNKAIHNVTFLKALQIFLYSAFKMELFAKKLWLLVVNYFRKKLHLKYVAGFQYASTCLNAQKRM